MDMEFIISKDKIKKHNKDAIGVNLMFNELTFEYICPGGLNILNMFFLNYDEYEDIETYLIEEEDAQELLHIITENFESIRDHIESIRMDRGYNTSSLDADTLLGLAMDNLDKGKKRYGMYLAFETVV